MGERAIDPYGPPDARALAKMYGPERVGAVLSRYSPERLQQAAEALDLPTTGTAAQILSAITQHVTDGAYTAHFGKGAEASVLKLEAVLRKAAATQARAEAKAAAASRKQEAAARRAAKGSTTKAAKAPLTAAQRDQRVARAQARLDALRAEAAPHIAAYERGMLAGASEADHNAWSDWLYDRYGLRRQMATAQKALDRAKALLTSG